MPHPNNDLGDSRIAKVQLLDESDDAGGMLFPPSISVSPLGQVTKEGGIAHVARLLPMPISWVPQKLGDETGFEGPVYWGSFPGGRYVLGQFERCSMALLNEDPDRFVSFEWDDDVM